MNVETIKQAHSLLNAIAATQRLMDKYRDDADDMTPAEIGEIHKHECAAIGNRAAPSQRFARGFVCHLRKEFEMDNEDPRFAAIKEYEEWCKQLVRSPPLTIDEMREVKEAVEARFKTLMAQPGMAETLLEWRIGRPVQDGDSFISLDL